MNIEQIIQNFRQTEALLLAKTPEDTLRFLLPEIDLQDRMIGVIGPRGVGKTTLLLQLVKRNMWANTLSPEQVLYFSADSVSLNDGELLKLATHFYLKARGRSLLIDEIHKFPNWRQELKNIYDSLPELQIIFSGSSSTSLIQGKYDLSRRAVTYILPGLSFREYLAFKEINFDTFSLEEIILRHQELSRAFSKTPDILHHLRDYLNFGYYPYFLENPNPASLYKKVLATIDKSIHEDISYFHNIESSNLGYFRRILAFLATITPGNISINKISKTIGKNNVTVTQYLHMLQDAYLVRFLTTPPSPNQLLKNKMKIFLDNPVQANSLAESVGAKVSIGTLRELFVLSHLQNSDLQAVFPETGDITTGDYTFEIGGPGKGIQQLQGIKNAYAIVDDILVGSNKSIPMYLFGFLY